MTTGASPSWTTLVEADGRATGDGPVGAPLDPGDADGATAKLAAVDGDGAGLAQAAAPSAMAARTVATRLRI